MKELTQEQLDRIKGEAEWEFGAEYLPFKGPKRLNELVLRCDGCERYFQLTHCSFCNSDDQLLFNYDADEEEQDKATFMCIKHPKPIIMDSWHCPHCKEKNSVYQTVQWPKPSWRKTSGSGGCFIATAVYGSDQCDEVVMLRQYRDEILLGSRFGRLLIKIYYNVSPGIANFLSSNRIIRQLIKISLIDPIVKIISKRR